MSKKNITTGTDTIAVEEVMETAKREYIKPSGFDADKDWTYLLDKEPSSNHILFAAIMRKALGEEALETASLEQLIYWFLAMHRWMQKSDANQGRPDFRGRDLAAVIQGSETLLERVAARAVVEGEDAPLVSNPNHISVELPKEDEPEPVKVTKSDLIAIAANLDTEMTEAQLKKLTVKKLEDLISSAS